VTDTLSIMNHLIHLYVAEPEPDLVLGAVMGDFVKGRLEGRFPPGVAAGILLHRRIDSFAQESPAYRSAKRLIDPRFGHYRGVMTDLFFDHFLAAEWESRHSLPLEEYLERTRLLFERNMDVLPESLRPLIVPIFREWMPRYREIGGMAEVLARTGRRVVRENRLAEGGEELVRLYPLLRENFGRFMEELQPFVRSEKRLLLAEDQLRRWD
jgi:acyl carrier protein phosphodiesterase